MRNVLVGPVVAMSIAVLAACSGGRPFTGDDGGVDARGGQGGPQAGGHAGNQSGTGGAIGQGGHGSGGSPGGGGATGTGGQGTGGGEPGGGGTGAPTGSGGAGPGGMGPGGAVGSGGTPGMSGTGGAAGTGGAGMTGSGGVMGTGGAMGTGGSSPACVAGKTHLCGATCADDMSTATCGTRCDPCTPPAGGTATCDGTSCGFTCGGSTPKQCLAAGICIASTGCCSSTDCPANAGGQTGTCDTATHTCNYSCTGTTKSCTTGNTTVCIPSSGCCASSDCTASCTTCDTSSHTCVAVKNANDPNGRCAGTCDGSGTCKSKQGQTCTTVAAGCIGGTSCADGYCCNTTCTGNCVACDVTGLEGTCSPIAAHTAPHGSRPACATDGSSCGGYCDGTGTCGFPSGTCGSPMCSGSGSSYNFTPASTCNGAGKCVAASAQGCGNFVCNGSMSCYTTCSSASQCVSNSICAAGVCTKCQSGYGVCGNNCYNTSTDPNHCGSSCAVCSGSKPSCANGSCTCRVPSSANKVLNPGFNTSLANWNTDGSFSSSNDAEGCNASGSLKLTGTAEQCVSGLDPNQTYVIGFLYKAVAAAYPANGTYCSLNGYSGANCGGTNVGIGATQVSSDGSSWVPAMYSGMSGAASLDISCGIGGLGIGSGPGYIDQVYVSPIGSPGF